MADAENDGRLSLSELYDTPLAARLVTLSRCQTGPDGGDAGLSGLGEGLLRSGAGAVAVNLWPLADAHAAAFMERFYGSLRAGPGAEALRAAQRATAEAASHPYFWAGFVLQGDWQ